VLTLVTGECKLGTLKVNDFNLYKVGVILVTCFLQKVHVYVLFCFELHF